MITSVGRLNWASAVLKGLRIGIGGLVLPALLVGITSTGVEAQRNPPNLAPVQLTPERRQLIGLQTATVEEKDLAGRIETTGLVEADEQLEAYVQTRFSGWIRQVFVNQTYQ